MVGLEVENMELRFESCCDELVHGDVGTIEFKAANTIAHIGIPSEAIGLQVEKFYVSIIVASSDATLFRVVRVAKGNSPAVRLDSLAFSRLEAYNRRLLAGVPNSDAAV